MKLKKYTILLLVMTVSIIKQAGAQGNPGYLHQENVLIPNIKADSQLYALSNAQKHTTRVFTDGLGRTIQTIAVQASPLQNDMIQPQAYDRLGRQTVSYLPYSGQSTDAPGSYRPNAVSTNQPAFYNQTSQYLIPVDTAPHARRVFEPSPMQRMLGEGSVGNGFQPNQNEKTISYRPNNSASDGNIYMTGTNGTFSAGTYYAANTLWVTDMTDESHAETRIFKDLNGHVVLKRQLTGNSAEPYLDTYYVYNNAGLIKYIVPPRATHLIIVNGYTLTSTPVANLIFTYTYNSLGQVTSRTAPGNILTSIIYDPLNRPVLVQDANMHALKQWYYTKYDAQNRPVITGTYSDAAHTTPMAMQTYVTDTLASAYAATWFETRTTSSTNYYYTDNVFPTASSGKGTTPLSYVYYDNYSWNGSTSYSFSSVSFPAAGPEGQPITTPVAATDPVKGIATMTMTRSIGPGIATPVWLMKVAFFDRYGNLIQTQSNNQLNYTLGVLTDATTNAPDFTGKPMASQVSQVTGSSNTVLTTFNYDVTNSRLADVDQVYNSQANVHIAHYNYNELGQVTEKNLGVVNGTIPATQNLSTTYSGTNTVVASSSITMSPNFSVPSGSSFLAYITTGSLQNVNYRYNIRGQLLFINNSTLLPDSGKTSSDTNDLFGMSIMYDQPDANISGATANYTGRISAVKWMSVNGGLAQTNERSYAYSYDALERYNGSKYAERAPGGSGGFSTDTDGFDEHNITYDENGNILTLNRNAATALGVNTHTQIDNLAYTYDTSLPNRLDAVSDGTHNPLGFYYTTTSSGSYAYDPNGNLTNEPYKGITLKYNLINKTDSITYTYDGNGNVLRKNTYNSAGTLTASLDYIGGFVYSSGVISYFPMPEGRVRASGTTLVPQYVIADQQGNARFSFEQSSSGGVTPVQETGYYAFGEIMSVSTLGTPTPPAFNNNLYNGGSEWQNEFTNLPDYHETPFRNYDPETGRFISVDPQPESAESMVNYQYAGNDPVNGFDPMGDTRKPLAPDSPPQPVNNLDNTVLDQLDADMEGFLDGYGYGDGGGGTGGYGGNYSDGSSGASNLGSFTMTGEVLMDEINNVLNDPFMPYGADISPGGIYVFDNQTVEEQAGNIYENTDFTANGGMIAGEVVVSATGKVSYPAGWGDANQGGIYQINGGFKNGVLDATFYYTGGVKATGLQIIQVAYVPYGSKKGSGKYIINGKTYEGLVDNGSQSYNQTSTGTVYYDAKSELQNPYYYWSGYGGFINVYDATNANNYYSSVVFETIIVATGYNGGSNQVLGSFTWGWNNNVPFGQPANINPNSLNSTISPNSQGVISHDFPATKFQ